MSSSSFSFGASPSVSKERWLKHAVQKMSKGYNLYVNAERKVANFYKGFGDFESCSYQTARKLISNGIVELVGEHELGMQYRLMSDSPLEVVNVVEEEIDEEDTDDVGIDSEDALEDTDDVIDDDMEENDDESSGYDDDPPLFGDEEE